MVRLHTESGNYLAGASQIDLYAFRRSPASTTSSLTLLCRSKLSSISGWLIPVSALIRSVSLQAWPVTLPPPLRRCRWVNANGWHRRLSRSSGGSDTSAGDGHGGAHLASGPTARSESSRVLLNGGAHGVMVVPVAASGNAAQLRSGVRGAGAPSGQNGSSSRMIRPIKIAVFPEA